MRLLGVDLGGANDLFAWQDNDDDHVDLLYRGRTILSYVTPTFDPSSPQSHDRTSKPRHHIYAPDGRTRFTGEGDDDCPYALGLCYGFTNITYDRGRTCDLWRCPKAARQEACFVNWYIGRADSRTADFAICGDTDSAIGGDCEHCVNIDWHGCDGEVFAVEQRTVGIGLEKAQGVEGWEIDFASLLEPVDDEPIQVDGEPDCSGLQLCLAEVAVNESYAQTDNGRLDFFRNDEDNAATDGEKATSNGQWAMLSFVLNGRRYSAVCMNHPDNPGLPQFVAQSHGRIGCCIAAVASKEEPLEVNFRIWIQEGEMTVAQCEAMRDAYPLDLAREIEEDRLCRKPRLLAKQSCRLHSYRVHGVDE